MAEAGQSRFPLPEDRLEEQLQEKAPAFTHAEALLEAGRCLYCHDAPCIPACPTDIDIPTFIRKIASENLKGSARTILSTNLLGASCARVCPVEVLCEGSCVYNDWDREPVQIGRLQRHAMDHGASPDLLHKEPPTGKSVGLVGAGPASLACGGILALLGHEAVLYERSELPGGLNTLGVAPYKMDATTALNEVAFVQALGVRIRTGMGVGESVTGEELLSRHDAVFLGPGLGEDSRLDIPGEDGPGVYGAVEWIERMKVDPTLSLEGIRHAVVIGGGNTALDVVREMAQLGVPNVKLLYRRGEAEMKGYAHEWTDAKKEGGVLVPNVAVTGIHHQGDTVTSVSVVPTRDGRPTEATPVRLPANIVILAIGQAKLRALVGQFPGVSLDKRGCIVGDAATGLTGNPRVFTGGDAFNGGKEVVNAVDEGQRAARAIDALLRGE